MAKLISQKAMNLIISDLEEVKGEVANEAQEIAHKASRALAPHKAHSDRYDGHSTGNHHVTVTHGDTDSFVNLEGDAPASLEFGHTDHRSGKHVNGLYILTRAAGLL